MKSFKAFIAEGENKQVKGGDPCWSGYQMVGKKKKNGKLVPNCVPESVEEKHADVTHPGPAANERYVMKQIEKEKKEKLKKEEVGLEETAAWQRKEGKNPEGGLNRKGIASYRRENPGSKLSMAVTTKPSKLKPGSKAANRRKSFCARMSGVDGPMKKPNGEPTRKALALRKWNC